MSTPTFESNQTIVGLYLEVIGIPWEALTPYERSVLTTFSYELFKAHEAAVQEAREDELKDLLEKYELQIKECGDIILPIRTIVIRLAELKGGQE